METKHFKQTCLEQSKDAVLTLYKYVTYLSSNFFLLTLRKYIQDNYLVIRESPHFQVKIISSGLPIKKLVLTLSDSEEITFK